MNSIYCLQTTILEGKYWKRRAEAVIAEYKKWRMFHIMRLLGKGDTSVQDSVNVLAFSILYLKVQVLHLSFLWMAKAPCNNMKCSTDVGHGHSRVSMQRLRSQHAHRRGLPQLHE